MSYILDALRRANAERERGTVPTLMSDPGPADLAASDDEVERRAAPRADGKPVLLIGAGAGALVLLLAAVWFWPRGSQPEVAVRAPAPPQQQPQPVAPVVAAATVPLQVPAQMPPVAEPTPAPVQAKPAAPTTPLPRDQLPPEIRQQLPALTAGGSMYSDTPAQRMLILNGQLLHEGDKITPDLVLEQIQLKGAVLSFKGTRFTISY